MVWRKHNFIVLVFDIIIVGRMDGEIDISSHCYFGRTTTTEK